MKFIPLGFQCTTAFVLQEAGVRDVGYPFDWGLMPPRFIRHILHLLLIDKMDTKELVRTEYFHTHTLAQWTGPGYLAPEEYREWHEGAPYNKSYGAIFPHDGKDAVPYEVSIQKYIRRMDRLKNAILDTDERAVFVYISQSSRHRYQGNYFIDGQEILTDSYYWLNVVYNLLSHVRGRSFDFLVLDTINSEDKTMLNPKIDYNVIPESNGYKPLIPQCVPYIEKYKRSI